MKGLRSIALVLTLLSFSDDREKQILIVANSLEGKFCTLSQMPNDTSSSHEPPPEPTSAFERWRRKAALVTGLGVTEEERMADLRALQTGRCEKTKTYLMNNSKLYHSGTC